VQGAFEMGVETLNFRLKEAGVALGEKNSWDNRQVPDGHEDQSTGVGHR
jgi:hypothetical protein